MSSQTGLQPTLPVTTAPTQCKVCGNAAPLFEVVDFNKSCEEQRLAFLRRSGLPVYYRRCETCGFLFTDAFDSWDHAAFQRHIYNADYIKVDPDYLEIRPQHNATLLTQLFSQERGKLRLLDWGGGNGMLASKLRAASFAAVETYDPFTPAYATMPTETFDIVSCFETIEHLPNPAAEIAAIAQRVHEPGIVVFSTLLQPDDIELRRASWWYLAPRNGHISLFSRDALNRVWRRHGFTVASFNENAHIAFRALPPFFRHQVLAKPP